MLAQTSVRIQAVTAGLDEAILRQAPAARQWSVVDVLAHRCACAGLWSYSIYAMLAVRAALSPAGWERRATIVGRGHSVYNSQVRHMALHEEEHSAQIEALCRGYRSQG